MSSTSSVATCEERISSATIEKATLAVLDRHDDYSKDALCAFLARCYPSIPVLCRKALVVAASTAARQAARLHGLVVRNNRSENVAFRKFAIGAADVLDCWGLGLNPPHRAGRTYERHQRINAEARAQEILSAEGAALPSEASPVTEARVRNAMASKLLPVPMPLLPFDVNPRDDLMSRAMADAGLENIVTHYDVCDLTQDMETNEGGFASAPATQEARRESVDTEERCCEVHLLQIGSAVHGHPPPAVVNREERMKSKEDELTSASKVREAHLELVSAEQRSREAYLLEIGSAVLGLPPPTVVNREEQYVPAGVTSSDELVVPNYVPTPVSYIHAASGAPVMVLSESDADDNNNINADSVPAMAVDAMSMIHAAVHAAEESMRAGVSDVPLVVVTDAQPSTSPVPVVETRRGSVNSPSSSTPSGSKRKPAAKDTDAPVAKKSSPTSDAATNDSMRNSTTNKPAAKGRTDQRTAPKMPIADDPRTNESVSEKSSVGGSRTISGPDSPAASGARGARDVRPTSSASTDASNSTSSTATADRADKSVRAPGNAGAEKSAPRKESTDDRYHPDSGLRLPVKDKCSTAKPPSDNSTAKRSSCHLATSLPIDIVLTASDMDDDASQPERSKSVRSAVVLVPLSSLKSKSKDRERAADKVSMSGKGTSDPKKDNRSSGPKDSPASKPSRIEPASTKSAGAMKEASSSKTTSALKEPTSTRSTSVSKEPTTDKRRNSSKDRSSSDKPTSGSKERSNSDKRASRSPTRSSYREGRRSRSRGRDDRRRSPSPSCQMTVPRAAREAMQKFLEEYGRHSKD